MELVEYNPENDDLVLKLKGTDFNKLTDLVSGVYSLYDTLDATALGVDEACTKRLSNDLYVVLKQVGNILEKRREQQNK